MNDFIELASASPCSNAIDFNHMVIMLSLLFYSFIKLGCLCAGHLFLTIRGSQDSILFCYSFDTTEVLMHSPRFLAVWTMAYIGRVNFLGKKDSLGAV